ncbi:DUF423 domain-containing protein [Indioceanicola profundi]|uniref:DUF423 domain-containing protein n=1 Tax=Indioceanicola profundi TaxID=2220096 RepID=UPI000E6AC505|nr:DUF423 domain-containing protein [Indioceanicola profundi]
MTRTDRTASALLLLAGLFGALAVACGAYAAHGLEAAKGPRAVELWGTASQYQMVHALAIAGVVALRQRAPAGAGLLAAAGWLFVLGCILFPGALYLLGWQGPSVLGAVAPIGGLGFILGWLLLAAAGVRGAGAGS